MKSFTAAKKWLGDLDAMTAGKVLTSAADVALIVSPTEPFIIRDISFGSAEIANEVGDGWIGKPWLDTVTVESRPKVVEMVRDADNDSSSRWRHVNHLSTQPESLPILYSATRLSPKGRIVAVGRSLRPMTDLQQRLLATQQGMDREFARLRLANTRYRLLFQVADEPVLVIDAATYKAVEANPAACHFLDEQAEALVGRPILDAFDGPSRVALEALFAGVRAAGRTSDARVRRAAGGALVRASVSVFREEHRTFLLLRLAADPATVNGSPGSRKSRVLEVVEHGPDGFVVTALDGRIEYANRAFLDMIDLATAEQAIGQSLDRWLGRAGVDFPLLTAHLRDDQSIRLFATKLRGDYGGSIDVEICAVAVPDGELPCLGFTVRNVSQRIRTERTSSRQRPRTVEQLTELVGRVPLKELVRDSSDMIERLCIEAALELTGDNRAAAAEILGLSRQSLYSKLRRYGLGDLVAADDSGHGAEH